MKDSSITKTFLYTSSTFKDVTSTATPYDGTWVGYTIYKFSVKGNQTWTRFATDFKYSGATALQGTSGGATLHSNYAYNTDNSLSTIQRPSKVMISFSTNKGSKEGNANEKLDIDMLRMIYDKGLSSLKIDGVENAALRNAYNNAEFATHSGLTGAGTNSGHTHGNYTAAFCYSTAADFPQVSATPKSIHVLSCEVTQATTTNHYAIIKVTHNDYSTFTDTIFFVNAVQMPTVTLSSNKNQTVCAGTAINAIMVTATNGTATVSNLPSGLSFNQSTGKISGTPTASGTYTVTVSNSACSVEETGTITVKPLPTITLTNNGVITVCEGSQVNVSATGADIYTWSDGLGSDAVAHPTTSGTYTVTGTNNSTGCSNTATATVTINPRPIVTLTPSATTVCTPATISLTAGGADSYSWAGITSSTNPAIVSAAGTYNVTVTGTNTATGCSNTASQTVTVNQTPTVQITGNNAFCAGDSSTLTVSSTPNGATFVWSDLSTSSTLKVKNAGKYFVTGTLNGCEGSDTMNVTVHEIPGAPTTTSNTICGMGQVALSASGTGGTCYWYANNTTSESLTSGNNYTPTLNTVGTMTYYVSVRSNEGCESSREPVTATAYALPANPSVSNIGHCGAGEFTLTATTAQGTTAHWFSDAATTQPVNDPNVSVSSTTQYYVYAADEHCSSNTIPMTITINEVPAKPTAISSTTICDQGTSQLTATPAAGCVLNWFNTSDVSGTPISTSTTYTTGQHSSSRKYYVVSKNNTTGCMSEVDSVTVNVYPLPGTPNVQNTTVCTTGPVTLSGTAGTDANTLKWYNADNAYLYTGTSYEANITASSTQFKVASYNSETGCEGDKVTMTVTVSAAITAPTVVSSTVYACGGNAELSATVPAGTLHWLNAFNSELATGLTYTVSNVDVATVYKVVAVVGNCSSDTIPMTVQPAEVPAAPTSDGNSRCGAGLITLTATVGDGLECRWYDSETSTEVRSYVNTYTPNISATTTYYVEAVNTNTQCVSATRTPVQAVVNPLPATPTVSNVAYCGAGTYTLTAGANGNTQGGFHWYSDAEGTQEIQSSVEMTTGNTYYVAWIDDQPCRSALASLAVTINPIPEMPTATAPAPYCSNTPLPVTLNAVPGANGDACRWYNADQTYLNIQQNSYGQNLSASTNYYVTTYNTTTGCESDLKLMAVVINSVPATPVVSGQSRCGAGTVTFTGEVSAPNTFRWYSADNTPLTEGGSYTTDALEANANYLVSTVNTETGCESQKVTVTATVHPAVVAPEVTTPQALCGAGTTTLTATTAQGNSLRWYADAQGETELTANANGSYTTPALTEGQNSTYYVGAYNPNCSGPLAAVTVNVYANPTIENVTDNNRCGAGNVTIEATASTDAQVRWYEAATGGESISTGSTLTLTNLQAPSTTVRYAEAYNSTTGCYSSTRVPVTAYVYETYTLNDPQEACDSFVWNGQPYYTSGNYTQTLQTIHNCDSVVTLQLTINNTKRTTVDSTVCDAISWLGRNYTESDTYVDTLTAASGCDSIVTLNLTVKRSTVGTENLTLCSAQLPYDYNGYQVTQAGTFTVTIDNTVGCDSVITLTVAVNTTPGNPTIKDTVRCGAGPVLMIANSGSNGGTCKWFVDTVTATSFHEGTQYNPTLSADTTFYVASFNPQTNCMSKRLPIKATINTIPEAPIVKDTARCGAGPVDLDVTVADPTLNVRWYANTATGAQVLNSGLQYNIQNLNATSTYYVESINMMTGCLSNRVPITATVNDIPAMPTVSEKTNCGPDTFNLTASNTTSCRWYETATATEPLNNVAAASYHTGTISESTSYFVTNYNAETGCESGKTEQIITIFTVYPSQDLYDEVCQGDTYTGYGQNVSYTESGVKDIVLATQSSNGCDSVVTLHLTVKATDQVTLTDSVCAGVPYTLHNFDTTFATAGTYTLTHTGTNMAGCDSTTTLMLTVNPVYTPTIEKTICEGQSFNFDGIDRTEPGTYVANLQSVTGCDSIVTLHLQVSDKHIETIIAHICAGETYQANGFNESTTGTYSHTDPTPSGCDSVTVLKLFVHELNTTNLRDTICLGESYSRYNITATPTTTGDTVITRVVPTQYNCDSTVVLTLTVNPSYDLHYSGEVCQGNRYTDYGFDTLVALSGTHTLIHSTTLATGCDSTVTVTLTVNPSYDLHYSGEVCQGENYVGYGFDTLVTQVGTHTLNHSTILSTGCDSIVTVNLTVNPVFSKDTTVSVCDVDVPYAWDYNHSYSVSGDYPIHYSRVNTGCDSVINLHLIVHNSMNKDTTVQICEGALPYAFDSDHVYSTGGNYTISLNSASGCDSIYQLHLVVTPSITHTQTLNICDNQLPYPYGDSTFNAAGTYEVVTTREDGCFEITYLTLNVHPTYQHSATFNICQSGLPYQVGDSIFTEAGTKTVHFTTPHSCDSAVTVTLIVNPEYAIADADTVCQSETPYHYAPENVEIDINTPGVRTYTYSHKTVSNCDSIVTFTLTVNPSYTNRTRSVTLCANSDQLPYTFGDTALTTSGVYTYNFHTVDGCDSIETLTFKVNPVYDTTITASICKGETYNENGFNLTPDSVGTHTYTRNLTSSLECDSTVNLVLTVNPTYYIPENVTVHSTTLPYLWHGHTLNESTTLYDSLTTQAGCDSVYYLTFTVTEFNIEHDSPIVMCEGSTQTWRNHPLTETGTYYDTVLTSNTIYMVDVTVNPTYHLYDTMMVCDNELPYFWHGHRFTGDSTLIVNYQTATAPFCDSIYTLTFIVNPTYNIHENLSVCESALPISWHGQSFTEPGFYTDSLQTAFGCDSIHTLTLNVTYVSSQEESVTVCGADATYAWHKLALSETGVYRDTLRNDNGCDSILYTLNFVKGLPFFQVDSVVLSGDQAYTWRGRQITAMGVYYDSLQTTVGCDSVYSLVALVQDYQMIQSNPISLCPGDTVTWRNIPISSGGTYLDTVVNGSALYIYSVVVTLNQSYHFNDTVTICQNALPYEWHGVNRTQSGVYYDRQQTVTGCDSVYTLLLTVNESYSFPVTQTICSNEAPYNWHGTDYYESGVYYDSLTTIAGCDSVYMLTLTVNPAIRQNDTAVTCQGTPYVWRGRQLQASGFYVDSVANTYGCEDVYTLLLTVNPRNYDTIRATICLGDTYAENGFNLTPTASGTVYDQLALTNQYGCDSIVSLVLTVNNSYLFETDASTCDGTPYEWRGGEYVVEGTYYDSYQTATGCDSVYVLHLTVNPTYEEHVIDSIHLHETYDNYGITVTPSDTGVYTYTINGFTQSGCDSIIYLTLVVQGNIGVNDYVAPQLRVYPNPATTYVIVEGERMQTIYVYDMYGRLVQVQEVDSPEYTRLTLENMAAGNYIIRIRLMDGVIISRKIIKKQM